ncbi:MAG: 5-oxoprolinase subunit B family protein [Nocardioides sp.]
MKALRYGESAVLLDGLTSAEILTVQRRLTSQEFPGLLDVVPAMSTLLVEFDPDQVTAAQVIGWVRELPVSTVEPPSGPVISIRVSYDGADLEPLADSLGMSTDELIRRHSAPEYTAAFCGFTAGFAYLVGGDPALNVPRRAVPRTRVPAGSVAIAERFSAVYPRSSPGGWHLLGHTRAVLWAIEAAEPALIRPGRRVRFVHQTDEDGPG